MENEELVNILKSRELSKEDRCLFLTIYLANKYYEGNYFTVDDKDHWKDVDTIVTHAVKIINNIDKGINRIEEDIIYQDDIVIILDNGTPLKLLLTRNSEEFKNRITSEDEKIDYGNYEIVDPRSSLGLSIIGRKVGDTVKYSDGESKNQHTVKILDHKRTKFSAKYSKAYMEAETEVIKRNKI
jgi:hypothetical protein